MALHAIFITQEEKCTSGFNRMHAIIHRVVKPWWRSWKTRWRSNSIAMCVLVVCVGGLIAFKDMDKRKQECTIQLHFRHTCSLPPVQPGHWLSPCPALFAPRLLVRAVTSNIRPQECVCVLSQGERERVYDAERERERAWTSNTCFLFLSSHLCRQSRPR